MSPILFLAGAFASIIVVGAGAVYLHDLWERNAILRDRSVDGTGGVPVFRGVPSPADTRSVIRGGTVVWVRAGGHPVATASSEPPRAVGGRSVVARRSLPR